MFTSYEHRYNLNTRDGETMQIGQAILQGPKGDEPGVVIRSNGHTKYVLRADHALTMCNAIVDALETHPNRESN